MNGNSQEGVIWQPDFSSFSKSNSSGLVSGLGMQPIQELPMGYNEWHVSWHVTLLQQPVTINLRIETACFHLTASVWMDLLGTSTHLPALTLEPTHTLLTPLKKLTKDTVSHHESAKAHTKNTWKQIKHSIYLGSHVAVGLYNERWNDKS